MFTIGKKGAIVGDEDDERALVEIKAFQRVQNFAYRPIELLHHIPVEPGTAASFEFVRGKEGDMWHDVGHVEKKGTRGILLDKLNSTFGKAAGELRLVGIEFDNFFAIVEGKRRHLGREGRMELRVVVRVRNA